MFWITGAILTALIVACAPFVWGAMREKRLTDKIRRESAPGKQVTLDQGTLCVVEHGPLDGPVVIMIHGFSAPHNVFRQNAQALARAGCRVILFDHFGRGWSDRPSGKYDMDFYDRELLGLFDALRLKEPVNVVGYSMGGIIATEFSVRHPARVKTLTLIAPAGLELVMFNNRFFGPLIRVPLIGDWVWRLFGSSYVTKDPQLKATDLQPGNNLLDDVSGQLKFRGYLPAVLATWRHLPMQNCDETFGKAAAAGIPISAIFGGLDMTVGIASADRLKFVAPAARIEIIAGANHALPYQMHEYLFPLLLEFIRSNETNPDRLGRQINHSVG